MVTKLLNFFLALALQKRKWILAISLAVTVLALGLGSTIKLDMKWTTLLPQSNPVVQEYIRVTEEYPLGSNYIIAVENDSAHKIERAVDRIEAELSRFDDSITATYGRFDEQFLLTHGLRTIKPKDLARAAKVFSDTRLTPYLTHLNDDLEREFSGDAERVKDQERELVSTVQALETLVANLFAAARGQAPDDAILSRTVRDLVSGNPYQFSLDKKMALILVAVKYPPTDLEGVLSADKQITTALNKIRDQLPDGTRIRTTGIIPVSRDEMESVGPYTMILFAVAMVLVFAALIWNFKSVLIPILALLPIVLGIIWSMGFYALTVKDLNIFTAMTMLVLIGLGIDFSIHMVTRFFEERGAGADLNTALQHSVISTGKGIFTGAMTTAMAFLALMTGSTKGTIDFGFCAGTGVIITLMALFTILPSLLIFWDQRVLARKGQWRATDFDFLGRIVDKITTRRTVTLSFIAMLGGGAFFFTGLIQYEYNLLKLEPIGLTSVVLQDEIVDRFKMSTDMAYVTCDGVEACRKLAKRLKKKKVVGEVVSIDRFIPAPSWIGPNDRTLAGLRRDLSQLRSAQNYAEPSAQAEFIAQLTRLLYNMIEIEELSFIAGQDRVVAATEILTGGESGHGRLTAFLAYLENNTADWDSTVETAARFSELMTTRLKKMAALSGTVTEAMIPAKYLRQYKNRREDTYLIQIYPKKNLYDRDSLQRFITSTDSLSNRIAGMPKLLLLINDSMVKDGWRALNAAGIVILLLLLLDLRSAAAVGLAAMPLAFGSLFMLGAMGLLGIKLNFINIIAIPVIIGIGVDDGIHVVHRWRQEGVGGLPRATAKVGHAVFMTSLTTMIGFGSIYFYTHRGMASLGAVLFIGVGFCFLATLFVIPSFGTFLEKRILSR